MEVGLIGIGKMGYNLVGNLIDNNIKVYCYDKNVAMLEKAKAEYNVDTYENLDDFLNHDKGQRLIWVMLPPGNITNSVLEEMSQKCKSGDRIIDGGNSNPKDSTKFGEIFKQKGAFFFDVGTSGGTHGARHGASFMIGGDPEEFKKIESIFDATSEKDGYIYTGKIGSGHFLKIVHNAILYGYMQSLAEGFEILEKSEYDYNLANVATSWSKTAVIRGWLLELMSNAFTQDENLDAYTGEMDASKSTNWVVEFAMNNKLSIPVMTSSLFARFKSSDQDKFSGKVVCALRDQVGGHGKK